MFRFKQSSLSDREIFLPPFANPKHRTSHGRVQLTVACRKRDNGGDPAVLRNDEIGPGVSWRLTRAARYPADQPAIARFRGLGNWLISEFRVSSFDRARDAVDFVTATIDSLAGVVENAIFSVNLVDGGAPASGIVFTEDITKIADQQGRDAGWHGLSPLGIECGLFHFFRYVTTLFVTTDEILTGWSSKRESHRWQ